MIFFNSYFVKLIYSVVLSNCLCLATLESWITPGLVGTGIRKLCAMCHVSMCGWQSVHPHADTQAGMNSEQLYCCSSGSKIKKYQNTD